MDGAVQSPVATDWHEQAIHSKITGVEDRGRINNEVMDRLTAVWEKGIVLWGFKYDIQRRKRTHILLGLWQNDRLVAGTGCSNPTFP